MSVAAFKIQRVRNVRKKSLYVSICGKMQEMYRFNGDLIFHINIDILDSAQYLRAIVNRLNVIV